MQVRSLLQNEKEVNDDACNTDLITWKNKTEVLFVLKPSSRRCMLTVGINELPTAADLLCISY